ncbi:hypothetical protein SKAU_G00132660 [Synaphobranchus kaupii]|uniref:Uncharacterized protein n=1 Tax=Synaphobranchus kaupii TaxID=118154 RepID=A0A9Q1FQP7_SYNKA|nr:hypothetical protein SKAU_G00132660 [Synaphobranchus kaupii]
MIVVAHGNVEIAETGTSTAHAPKNKRQGVCLPAAWGPHFIKGICTGNSAALLKWLWRRRKREREERRRGQRTCGNTQGKFHHLCLKLREEGRDGEKERNERAVKILGSGRVLRTSAAP